MSSATAAPSIDTGAGTNTPPDLPSSADPDILARVKLIADTFSSVIGALTVSAAFVGSVWVVIEAFNLPDGLPRLDASTFGSLASAVAVAGVMFIAYCSVSVGGAGFALRRWRRAPLASIRPGLDDTRIETAQFGALFAVTAILGVWQAIAHDVPLSVVLVAIAIPPVITMLAMPRTSVPKAAAAERFTVLLGSVLSTLVWFPSLFILDNLVLGTSAMPHSLWGDVIVSALFLLAAASINYLSAVARPTAGLAVGLAVTLLAATLNPQMMLGAPFRAIKLIDVTIRIPQPTVVADRDALAGMLKNCRPDIVIRLPSRARIESYEVFVRQRIGLDWTVNCMADGGTVTFPRSLATGTLPIVSPTPTPLRTSAKPRNS